MRSREKGNERNELNRPGDSNNYDKEYRDDNYKEYRYKSLNWAKKLIPPVLLIFIGIIAILYIPTDSEFVSLLIMLIAISGFMLLIFDTIPSAYRSHKCSNQKVVLNKDYIAISQTTDKNNFLVKSKIKKDAVTRVVLKSQGGKYLIKSDEVIEDIDNYIHKMYGRRLILTADKKRLIIYLELLENEFLLDFFNWYQQ